MGRVTGASAAKKTTCKRRSTPPGWLHAPAFATLPSPSASPLTGPGRKPTNLTRDLRFPAHQDGEGEQRGFVGEQEQIWPPVGPPELLKARAAQAAEPPAPVSPSHKSPVVPKGVTTAGAPSHGPQRGGSGGVSPRRAARCCPTRTLACRCVPASSRLHTKPPGPERGAEGRGKSLIFPSSKDECSWGPSSFLFIYFF